MITACARRESGVWTPVSRRVTGVQAPPSRREDFAGAYAPCTRRLYGVYTASIRRLYGVYITSRSRLELVYFPLLTPSTRRLRAAHAPSTRRLCADILYGKVSRLFLNFAPSNLSSLCVTRTALYVAFIRDSVRGALVMYYCSPKYLTMMHFFINQEYLKQSHFCKIEHVFFKLPSRKN